MIPMISTDVNELKQRIAERAKKAREDAVARANEPRQDQGAQKPRGQEQKKDDDKPMTIEEIFSHWNHKQTAIWEDIASHLKLLSSDDMKTLSREDYEGFKSEIMGKIEEMRESDESGTVSRRWHLVGIEKVLKNADSDVGLPLPYWVFERMEKLNGRGASEMIVTIIEPKEADEIEKMREEYFTALYAAKNEGRVREFQYQTLPIVFEVWPKHEGGQSMGKVIAKAMGSEAKEYVRKGRMYFKLSLDMFGSIREAEKGEFGRIAWYLNDVLELLAEDVEKDQMIYGRFLEYYGVRRNVRVTLKDLSLGKTGLGSFSIHEMYPVKIKGREYSGGFVVRGLIPEGHKRVTGKDLPEGVAALQFAVHESSPMFSRIMRLYKEGEGVSLPESRNFRKGTVLEMVGIYDPKAGGFLGIENSQTGKVDDILYGILSEVLRVERMREEKRENNPPSVQPAEVAPMSSGPEIPAVDWDARPAETPVERQEVRREQRRNADHVKRGGKPAGKKEKGGAKNFRKEFSV